VNGVPLMMSASFAPVIFTDFVMVHLRQLPREGALGTKPSHAGDEESLAPT
jgi:hypothetical protein